MNRGFVSLQGKWEVYGSKTPSCILFCKKEPGWHDASNTKKCSGRKK
jgi:hypothetical protein